VLCVVALPISDGLQLPRQEPREDHQLLQLPKSHSKPDFTANAVVLNFRPCNFKSFDKILVKHAQIVQEFCKFFHQKYFMQIFFPKILAKQNVLV
jgi:hypothetical protein